MERKGFTLIEILVVIAVTALLSGLAIVYSHVGQNQVSLSLEASKVAQLILEAKELSISTYSDKQLTCGYGVHFDYAADTYSLFEYDMPSPNICPSVASTTAPGFVQSGALVESKYQSGSWNISPATGVELVGSGGNTTDVIQDVVFYPPDPFTLVSYDGNTFYDSFSLPGSGASDGNVYLQTVDSGLTRMISVNFGGQVNL